MPYPDSFEKIDKEEVGSYNHYNDKWMAKPQNAAYVPPASSQSSFWAAASMEEGEAELPRQPKVVIIERQKESPWLFYHLGRMTERSSSGSSAHQTKADDGDNEKEKKAGILAAIGFFALILGLAVVGAAYSLRVLPRIDENIRAKRKLFSNGLRIASAIVLGYFGFQIGMSLGAYYGPALLGTAFMGSFVSGMFLMTTGIGAGFYVGKYLAKLGVYIYTRGKTTHTDGMTLAPSVEEKVEAALKVKSTYPGSRPNLMLAYIVNKIELAKQNQADKQWLETLAGYRYELKKGKLTESLKNYFNDELKIIKYTLGTHASVAVDPELDRLENDYKALMVITCQPEALVKEAKASSIPTQTSVQKPKLYPDLAYSETATQQPSFYYPTYMYQSQQPSPYASQGYQQKQEMNPLPGLDEIYRRCQPSSPPMDEEYLSEQTRSGQRAR